MPKQKVLIVFGTRPEAIKMAPLVKQFRKHPDEFELRVCVTAQHREMLDQVLSFFTIEPDFDLDLMRPGQELATLTADILKEMKGVLDNFKPDLVLVQGDTTTCFATSLAAFYAGTKVCHVEAGLRTHNKLAPFPEEINRQLTGRLADIHFTPTKLNKQNLLNEGIDENRIIVTGNTVIDALHLTLAAIEELLLPEIKELQKRIDPARKLILVTGHRRENFGEGFQNICLALKEIAGHEEVQIIYPVHLNPKVQKPVHELLGGIENIHLIEPLSYEVFVWLMNQSYLIITDSGGIQEEAPGLGKPVLVTRNETEREEAIQAGTVILVGTDSEKIVSECITLLNEVERYEAMSILHNPYGDGSAAVKIVTYLLEN